MPIIPLAGVERQPVTLPHTWAGTSRSADAPPEVGAPSMLRSKCRKRSIGSHSGSTRMSGSPSAAACRVNRLGRTPWTAMRSSVVLIVVMIPTISAMFWRRASRSGYALSFPEFQDTKALGKRATMGYMFQLECRGTCTDMNLNDGIAARGRLDRTAHGRCNSVQFRARLRHSVSRACGACGIASQQKRRPGYDGAGERSRLHRPIAYTKPATVSRWVVRRDIHRKPVAAA